MRSDADYTREAQKIWNALVPLIDNEINIQTRAMIRAKKMTVITPPNGSTVGVAEPFGKTLNIPYSSAISTVVAGDAVWVWNYFTNASTMIAMATGDGQILPQYNNVVAAQRNLITIHDLIQTSLTTTGDLVDPSADPTDNSFAGICTTATMIPVAGSSPYTLTLYDDRIENIDGYGRVSQYTETGTFIGNAIDRLDWKKANSQTVTLKLNAAFVRVSIIGCPMYRWKFEKSPMTTDWQPSPLDIL